MKAINKFIKCGITILLCGTIAQCSSVYADDEVYREKGTGTTIRIISFDFTTGTASPDRGNLSRIFRDEFKQRAQFSVLDIEEINKALVQPEHAAPSGTAQGRAIYIGKSVNSHKVIIGRIRSQPQSERLTVEIVDTMTGTPDFSEHLDEERLSAESVAAFSRQVADRMLGIAPVAHRERAPREHILPSHITGNHAGGLSFGIITPWKEISPYLNNALLVKAHYAYPTDLIKNSEIDCSIGYDGTETKNSISGIDMVLVPITATLSTQVPLFSSPMMPIPVLYGGCGITYLSLSGTATGQTISKQGVDITALAGIGLSFKPADSLVFQLQTMLYYLYEDILVTYYYYGIMMQYRM